MSDVKSMSEMPLVACIDFDGTLVESAWPGIGAPRMSVINGVKQLRKEGYQLVLHTCRTGDHLRDAIGWCLDQGLMFDAINTNTKEMLDYWCEKDIPPSPKPSARIYIDDLAVNADDFARRYEQQKAS